MKKNIKALALTLLLMAALQMCIAQVSDIDGNKYKTTVAGTQTWTAENLDVTHFLNGDAIAEVKSGEDWIKASDAKTPAWCYYDNDPANGKKYGKLYNWYAVNDPRSIAPEGWRVPFESDWVKLVEFAGGHTNAAFQKMRSLSGWGNTVIDKTETGFAALPGGYRYDIGNAAFENKGSFASWWSASKYRLDDAYIHNLSSGGMGAMNESQGAGMSVRLVKK